MQVIDVEQAKTSLDDLLDAAIRGQEIVLTRHAQPVAKLVPLVQRRPRPQFGTAKGLVHIADDFDAPLADFDEYVK
jgi:prevent-host-death family protein